MADPMIKYLKWSLVLIGIMSKGNLDMILLALSWYLSHPILLQQSYKALLYFYTHFEHWFLSTHVITSINLFVYDYTQSSQTTSHSTTLPSLYSTIFNYHWRCTLDLIKWCELVIQNYAINEQQQLKPGKQEWAKSHFGEWLSVRNICLILVIDMTHSCILCLSWC